MFPIEAVRRKLLFILLLSSISLSETQENVIVKLARELGRMRNPSGIGACVPVPPAVGDPAPRGVLPVDDSYLEWVGHVTGEAHKAGASHFLGKKGRCQQRGGEGLHAPLTRGNKTLFSPGTGECPLKSPALDLGFASGSMDAVPLNIPYRKAYPVKYN